MPLFIFDLDGVIMLGKRFIPGAASVLRRLIDEGNQVFLVTNNTRLPRRFYVSLLRRNGVRLDREHIITASFATALYIKRHFPKGSIITVIGEPGIREEIRKQGFKVIDAATSTASAVCSGRALVVAMDRRLSYTLLWKGLQALANPKTLFIAANRDTSWPTEYGIQPGTGSFVAALEAASGRPAQVSAGKPEKFIFQECLRAVRKRPKKIVVIGDRLDSDILPGNRIKALTVLVLTGVATRSQGKKARGLYKPGVILESINKLIPAMKKRGIL